MSEGSAQDARHAPMAALLREHFPDTPQLAADLAVVLSHHPAASSLLPTVLQAVPRCPDPARALTHFLRCLETLGDTTAFWHACLQRPEALAALLYVLAASQFLSSILWRSPHLLVWLITEALWQPEPTPQDLSTQLDAWLQGTETEAGAGTCLRAFTQQHLLRIGARDLCGLAEIADTTAALSSLAECVVRAGLAVCERALTALHGTPTYTDDDGVQHPCGFCVIGMGKLGAYELNFSSDIDIMYLYTSYQGQTSGSAAAGQGQGQISNHEYFVALARRLTTMIGGQGPDGQAFRVDLRLRPEGTQGQLALSLLSYEAYYARLGQTWERMALLKARPIAGDQRLGAEFLTMIQPFVYQRHLDAVGIRHLRDLKDQIDLQLADKAQSHTNVKLGLGGIREIEFIVQLPQLLFGGRYPALQERHSLRAMTHLREAGLLSAEVEDTLRTTYLYLRRLEHYLQMEQGAQTHMLPRQAAQQRRVARHFGHDTWEAFYHEYLARTAAVHALFLSTFQTPPTDQATDEPLQ